APLRERRITTDQLAEVQRRRTLPMKIIQGIQIAVQSRMIDRLLDSEKPITAPWTVKLFNRFPVLRRIPARIVGIGIRPEHVHSRERENPVGRRAKAGWEKPGGRAVYTRKPPPPREYPVRSPPPPPSLRRRDVLYPPGSPIARAALAASPATA